MEQKWLEESGQSLLGFGIRIGPNTRSFGYGKGNDACFVFRLRLTPRDPGEPTFIVLEAGIDARFQMLDTRASIFKLLASIRASSPLDNIFFAAKRYGPPNRNLLTIFIVEGDVARMKYYALSDVDQTESE